MQITFDRKTVNECLLQKFALPTYQRGYKWEPKHLSDLLTDIQESFLSCWVNTHGRSEVLGYDMYFLGTIITTDVGNGGKAIIDGQQRISTLMLLLTYISRVAAQQPDLAISPVGQSIRRQLAGKSQYNLDMDAPRRQLFDALLNDKISDEDLADAVDSIADMDDGTKRLWELYQSIPSLIAQTIKDKDLLPFIADYITDRVCLFEIGVPKEQDGHKVFVTMNDRGLKLTPIDLLKGFLLSSIAIDAENKEAHEAWLSSIRGLQQIGSDEDSNFFKTWLRAKFARSIRGKRRGDEPGDFELIGDSYHRWVMDHREHLALRTGDDFYKMLTATIPFYASIYQRIKEYEKIYTEEYRHVYFNGARALTLQTMAILAAVQADDSSADVDRKIKAIAYYLDHMATARSCQGKENTYDNVRDIIFEFALEIRDLSATSLKDKLEAKIAGSSEYTVDVGLVSYNFTKRQDLLHLMARIADSLEREISITNGVGFADYVDRTLHSRTFDVEHILPMNFTETNADITAASGVPFSTASEFIQRRSEIGGLILLPRGRNRSLKAMRYTDKRERYATENVLASSLTSGFYLNNPDLTKFLARTSTPLREEPCIDGSAIAARTQLYQTVADGIWHHSLVANFFT